MSRNLRTPLATVRGHGSAHDGTHHFIVQRLTALALIPLALWLVIGLVCHTGASHTEFRDWVASFPVALALILTIIATFWHASIGLQVVLEDYVHRSLLRMVLLMLVKGFCVTLSAAGVLSVILIAVG